MKSEGRQSVRRPANEAARIVYRCGHSVLCRVRNISDSGAGLEMSDGRRLPDSFQLEIGGQASRPAQLVWHAVQRVGVRFTDWLRREQPKNGFGRRCRPTTKPGV